MEDFEAKFKDVAIDGDVSGEPNAALPPPTEMDPPLLRENAEKLEEKDHSARRNAIIAAPNPRLEWERQNAEMLAEKDRKEKECRKEIIAAADAYKEAFMAKRKGHCKAKHTKNRDKEQAFLAAQKAVDKQHWKAVLKLIQPEIPTIETKRSKGKGNKGKTVATINQGPKPGKATDRSRMLELIQKLAAKEGGENSEAAEQVVHKTGNLNLNDMVTAPPPPLPLPPVKAEESCEKDDEQHARELLLETENLPPADAEAEGKAGEEESDDDADSEDYGESEIDLSEYVHL